MSTPSYPLIPYGWANFRNIRLEGRLYVDKTAFLRPLEDERFVFLIRPRRFGKSCWLSLLEHYYDRKWADEFEAIFGGTDIGEAPTANRHSYVTVRFDFSLVKDTPETLEQEFDQYCGMEIEEALENHPDLFSDDAKQRILAPASTTAKLNELFRVVRQRRIRLYILIDEYDNFANTILAHHGSEAYHAHGGEFYRNFFAVLKGGAGRGSLERLFVTGVSLIDLDGLTGGFNIGRNISSLPNFNAVLGFTEAEVRDLLSTYRKAGVLTLDVDAALAVMRDWYDGYRFCEAADETVYSTDTVLYFPGLLSVDLLALADAVWRMAKDGEWRPALDFLRDAIREQTNIHDYLDGKEIVQGFLAAYFRVSRHFMVRTETELNKGFADIALEPLVAQHAELRHGFLIEVKYIKRGEEASEDKLQAVTQEAEGQLLRYLADERLTKAYPTVTFAGLVVVFHGWEMVWCEAAA